MPQLQGIILKLEGAQAPPAPLVAPLWIARSHSPRRRLKLRSNHVRVTSSSAN